MDERNRSMYDLEAEFSSLLDTARQGFDDATGEATDEELLARVDAAFLALGEDIERKVAGTALVVLRLRAESDAVAEEIRRLQRRGRKLEGGEERLKDRLRDFMSATSTTKVVTPFVGVTLGKPTPIVDVIDASLIPTSLLVFAPAPPPRADKAAIAAALKAGESVPGCALKVGKPRLGIR